MELLMNNNLQSNLIRLMSEHNPPLSQNSLSRESGVPQATIHRICTDPAYNPRISTVQKLAKYFDISFSSLIGEKNIKIDDSRVTKNLPIIPCNSDTDWSNLKNDNSYLNNNIEKFSLMEVSVGKGIGARAFAVNIFSESMKPVVPQDSTLIIDPDAQPRNGSLVLAVINEDPIVREYSKEAGSTFLKPYDARFPVLEIDSAVLIIGTVVQLIKSFI